MKNLLFSALVAVSFSQEISAQVSKVMPPDADEFYNKSMPLLRSQVKQIVLQTAASIKHRTINGDSLSSSLYKHPQLKGMSNNDIEGITVLIMVQASKDADDDLKKMVLQISRSSNQNNSLTKENDSQNSKLQVIMDRKSGMAEEIGYVMKKISGNPQDIIANLK
jgi:hypothetical protein